MHTTSDVKGHRKGVNMGDKGKKDKGKREEQKKSKRTLREKRKQKSDKTNVFGLNEKPTQN
jgi:hypothetical protein